MTFEEFENASGTLLRAQAKDCFDRANENPSWGGAPTLLLQAQFYLQELDRRQDETERKHNRWIARRDLILEVIVIALIGGKIFLGWQEGKNDDALMKSQTGVLQKLNDSASSTATSQAATAKTLIALESTSEAMNAAVQGQLALYYDVSLNVVWLASKKGLNVLNNGRTNIALWGFKVGSEPETIGDDPRIITPAGGYQLDFASFHDQMTRTTPKGNNTLSTIPLVLYLKNEKQDEFVLNETLVPRWEGDTLVVNTQTVSIVPEHWTRTRKSR